MATWHGAIVLKTGSISDSKQMSGAIGSCLQPKCKSRTAVEMNKPVKIMNVLFLAIFWDIWSATTNVMIYFSFLSQDKCIVFYNTILFKNTPVSTSRTSKCHWWPDLLTTFSLHLSLPPPIIDHRSPPLLPPSSLFWLNWLSLLSVSITYYRSLSISRGTHLQRWGTFWITEEHFCRVEEP